MILFRLLPVVLLIVLVLYLPITVLNCALIMAQEA
jgi:hypothetical protein